MESFFFELENEQAFKDDFVSFDLNLEYDILPYEDLTPFIYAGTGLISDIDIKNPYVKFQYGVGIEFLPTNNFGIKLFGEQNLLLTDELDGFVNGKRDDFYWKFGVGLNFYIGKPYNRVKSVIFE